MWSDYLIYLCSLPKYFAYDKMFSTFSQDVLVERASVKPLKYLYKKMMRMSVAMIMKVSVAAPAQRRAA